MNIKFHKLNTIFNLFKALLLSLFVFVLFISEIAAQTSLFQHYSVEQGLPSSEIYAQVQDDDGYMWFATSKGVSRFDGYEFVNYTIKDGLPTNSVIDMYKDYTGRIWFCTYDGSLSFYENGSIIKHENNDTIKQLAKNYFIDNIYLDSLSNLYIMPSTGGLFKITKSGEITNEIQKYSGRSSFFVKKMPHGFIWGQFPQQEVIENNTITVKNNVYYLNLKRPKSIRRYYQEINNNEFLISFGNTIFHIKNNIVLIQKKFDNDISGLLKDNSGNLWISVMYEGLYMFENENLNNKPKVFLRGKSPISTFQDIEGNYWFSTTESGVYFVPSFQFNSYKKFGFSDFNILSIEIFNDILYFSTYDKQVFKCNLENDRILSIENIALHINRNNAILDIFANNDSSIWFLGTELYRCFNEQTKIIDTISRGYKLCKTIDNNILSTSYAGFRKFDADSLIFELIANEIPIANSIYQDITRKIYLGTINGLYCFFNNSLTYLGEEFNLLKTRIADIKKINNYLLLATSGEGLVVYDLKKSKIYVINERNGLSSNFVNTIFIQDSSVIWIGTNKGLCKLEIEKSENFSFKTEKYNKSDGLYSEEIKDIAIINNCIYLGTSQGLISFYPFKLKKTKIAPKIILDSLLINDTKFSLTDNSILQNSQNNITFLYKAISFRANQKLKYKYKLEGFDEKWVITANKYIRFPNLPSGKYTFILTASTDGVNWNKDPLRISFKIKKHFTESVIFIIFIILSVILIIGTILFFIYKNLKKNVENVKKLLYAEQKALRSQMNPHFIFNALNSIRRYILENDSDTADDYLTSFASLMRFVLDNSKHNMIPLETEIQTLRLYLELEKMRFDETFVFSITKEKGIDMQSVSVPPMLIQPYLENAIWHGLAPKSAGGVLKINFQIKNKNLICTIIDNGIGREKSAIISKKRKGHVSTGIKNIEERINLINSLSKKSIEIHTIDLFDNNKKPEGTKIIIFFPLL